LQSPIAQPSNERSVKNKKDIKEESVAKKQNDMASQQSQIKKNNDQESLIIKEKQGKLECIIL
jgi:hypothetical protein